MKRIHVLILAVALVLALPATALADSLEGSTSWTVTYTAAGQLEDNYSKEQYADAISRLEPGDDITFTVNMSHQNSKSADWYLSNKVLKTLEEGTASGSAYGYRLTYSGKSGQRVLYDSEQVGGDDSQGLKDATNALDDYIFLENLSEGDTGTVKLRVKLDGETEGNAYFNTLARVNMKFAVEVASDNGSSSSKSSSSNRTVVQTGDDTDLFPFFVAMVVSGALLLLLGLYGVRERRREQE